MPNKVTKRLMTVPTVIALALMYAIFPAVADDTEIYQAEYDANSSAGRAKVLIVFDDSGSMDTEVVSQPPPYDSSGSYATSVPANRIYWSTDGEAPSANSDNWFEATQNRCDSSYDDLSNNGKFTTLRARRWVDSTVQEGQCSNQCPDGSQWRNYPGNSNDGCYESVETSDPVEKLVFRENDSNDRCDGGLTYVEFSNGSDACYELVTSSSPVTGWVYRRNDNNNNRCGGGTTYMYVDPPGWGNASDACYEEVTEPEFDVQQDWVYVGPRERVCEEDTPVPGTWQSLSRNDHTPTHVECLDDVTDNIDGNGLDQGIGNQGPGFPQNNVTNGNEYGPDIDTTVEWRNEVYTFYTSHHMNWYHDSSLITTRTRLDIAQDVVGTIIDTNPSIDFGLVEFNYEEGGRVAHRIIQGMTEAQRDNLIVQVNRMDHAGATPMCESMYEAYRYISGQRVVYGNEAVSGSDSRGEKDVLDKDELAESDGIYITPNTDCAHTYIILITDGEPSRDTGANSRIETLTGLDCDDYRDADGDMTKNCLPQLTKYMANNDLAPNTDGEQLALTYTIGFDTDQELLEDAATNGEGQYYTANSVSTLTNAFQGAIVSILSKETTFTSPAVAVDTFTRTQSRDEVFYAMFKPSSQVDWIGNIKKLKLRADAVLVDAQDDPQPALNELTGEFDTGAVTYWGTTPDGPYVEQGGVGALLAARDPADRTIYSNTGDNSALELFNTANFDAAALGEASNADFYALLGASTQSAANSQINWARGFDAYDIDNDSDTSESRGWLLGDILHSQPLVINYGARGSFTELEPDLRLLVGSNSGFVHLFGNADGHEDWAFFPKELASILPLRRRNAFSNDHVYGMDLTAVSYVYDANLDGSIISGDGDKVWAFLGMRRGGHAYYALDLSNPDTPSFMWKIDNDTTGFEELGQTWSEPVVTTIPGHVDGNGVRKPVLIFGAGYDTGKDAGGVGSSDVQGRGLFIVDAETGALVWSVTPAANSATNLAAPGLLHSVPGSVTVLDSNGDDMTDRVYFGDTGGNVWRVDLPGNALPTGSQDTWQINRVAALNGGNVATDRRFFNAPDVVRIRLEGDAVDAIIIGSGDRTNPNATDVNNQIYMIRDYATATFSTERPTETVCTNTETADVRCDWPIREDDLFDITDNPIITGVDDEPADAIIDLAAASGWRYDLGNSGEKNLASSITINGRAFVPTFTPSNLYTTIDSCNPESGTGLMYVFDIYNGDVDVIHLGPIIPDTPSLHFSEDGTIRILLPPGAPPSDFDGPGDLECEGGVCDLNEFIRPPYGNFWFQEEY